jgi:hypothetical protein
MVEWSSLSMKTKRRLILISAAVVAMNLSLIGCNAPPEATTATSPTAIKVARGA